MAKATIKSKTGAVITIEGTQDEVSNIVSTVERATVMGHAKKMVHKQELAAKEIKKRRASSDLVIELREVGFFDKPKALGEISEALEEQGHLIPTTTLSGVVLGLVKRKFLSRKKLDGKWAYGK